MRLITVGLVVLVLSACQTTAYSTADAQADAPLVTEDRRLYMLAELDRQQELWSNNKPKKYTYKIREKKVITPWDVSVLERNQDKSEITLMTCWPIGTTLNRLIVTWELVEIENETIDSELTMY